MCPPVSDRDQAGFRNRRKLRLWSELLWKSGLCSACKQMRSVKENKVSYFSLAVQLYSMVVQFVLCVHNQTFVHCVLMKISEEVQLYSVSVFPPGLDQCPDGPRGGQLTPCPTAGGWVPWDELSPHSPEESPQAFPSLAALGGLPQPGQSCLLEG